MLNTTVPLPGIGAIKVNKKWSLVPEELIFLCVEDSYKPYKQTITAQPGKFCNWAVYEICSQPPDQRSSADQQFLFCQMPDALAFHLRTSMI